ncbi:MAG: hypothetical protein PVI59_04965 [Anaerolineae bacterium]|jgi:hypothetical protein
MSYSDRQGQSPQHYRAYLLRMWQEAPGQPWRALLQDAGTHERYGFADLDRLLAFLHAQIDQECGHLVEAGAKDPGEVSASDD